MVTISNYMDPELVKFFDVPTRNDVLSGLVDLLYEKQRIDCRDTFYQAILEREKIVSTGIGMGVAIPHAKLANFDDFFIAVGIHSKGINWNALDGSPVHLIFMIGGPNKKQTQYLQLLSLLTTSIKDEGRRKSLLHAENNEEIISLFEGF